LSLDEVRPQLLVNAKANKGESDANAISDKISAVIRKSNKIALDDLAKQFNLKLAEKPLRLVLRAVTLLWQRPAVKDELFRLQQGQVSMPLKTDRGYVVLSLKTIIPPHAGTLEEERNKVAAI